MFVEPFVPFLLFVLALYATPGPATLSIAASGSAFGFRKTIPFVLGLITGLGIIFIMVALGLSALFSNYPAIHILFKWVSLIYMIYLSYQIASAPSVRSTSSKKLGWFQGITLTMVNPKAYFAVIATAAQFAPANTSGQGFMAMVFWALLLTLITNLLWASAGGYIGSRVAAPGLAKKINLAFATLLIGSVIFIMFF